MRPVAPRHTVGRAAPAFQRILLCQRRRQAMYDNRENASMASQKDDASTDIEALTKKFAEDMSSECASLRKSRVEKAKKAAAKAPASKDAQKDPKKDPKKEAEPPVVSFVFDPSKATQARTPAEQAAQVVAGRSWVCWGAHMADKARHVMMKVDGKVSWDPKKALGEDFDEFKKIWAATMKRHGLKNAAGKDGWYEGDAFHLELSDSKIAKTDDRVKACFDEYARLSRQENKGKNDKFEKNYASDLKAYLEKYTPKEKK